ncbi:hypothetical protein LTR62_004961 [Meristemomyces frigidus]|uniref:Ankyrin n=1 Tax=Meristemomyces frigidus TaxID=1508187 RepID=A0AAN7TW80_9PEZI|nr:hypothetical protein LTR62_004961 [Meristemomyces frigidus]
MSYDTMSAWNKTTFADKPAFEFNDSIQRRGGIWAGNIDWNSPPGRSLSNDDYIPPPSHTPSSKTSRTSISVEMPVAPLFRDATSNWSPPASPTSLSPPDSPRVDSACTISSPTTLPSPTKPFALSLKERQKLAAQLHAASCAGDIQHMDLLLSLGASVNSRTLVPHLYESFKPAKTGILSPLAGAAGNMQLAAVQYLHSRGAKINPGVNESSSSPLHEAVKADDLAIARFLLERGADVDSANAYNTTPLMYAVKYSSPATVSLLLDFRPDLSRRSFFGGSAIHWAVWPNRPTVLDLLLQAGADVNHRQGDGSTGLHLAVTAERVESLKCLLRWGADVGARNDGYETVVQVAEKAGNEEVLALVRAAAATGTRR